MEEIQEITTKYALFKTIEAYNEANNKISIAFGLPDSHKVTERYSTTEPQQDVDGKFIMEISVAVQMFHSESIKDLQLYDTVNYYNISDSGL